LYWLSISVPYMREIRGPFRANDNVLLLGELHQRVIRHIDTLIKEPERLIGPNASYSTGSLDGNGWERPEAFYAVQRYAQDLPHLKELLVAFLEAARDTWKRFSAEYEAGGDIAAATPEQIDKAWMESTNDLSEGSFATFRQTARRNPTMSLVQYNSRQMYKFNDTSEYIRSLSPEMRKFLRKVTRRQDESGANRETKLALARHKEQVSIAKAAKARADAEKMQAEIDEINRVHPVLSSDELDFLLSEPRGSASYVSVQKLNMQLKWQKRYGVKEVVTGSVDSWGNRDAKIALLRTAISACNTAGITGNNLNNFIHNLNEEEEQELDPEVTLEDLDAYESEDDYYER
jgi:hypothetical protein